MNSQALKLFLAAGLMFSTAACTEAEETTEPVIEETPTEIPVEEPIEEVPLDEGGEGGEG